MPVYLRLSSLKYLLSVLVLSQFVSIRLFLVLLMVHLPLRQYLNLGPLTLLLWKFDGEYRHHHVARRGYMRSGKKNERIRLQQTIFALRNARGRQVIGQVETTLLEVFFIVLSSLIMADCELYNRKIHVRVWS